MKILGIKLTHDASFSIIDNNKLICCLEIEKIANNTRNSEFTLSKDDLEVLLKNYGYSFNDFDSVVFDGWYYSSIESSFFTGSTSKLNINDYGVIYFENEFPYEKYSFNDIPYFSNYHLEGHLWSAYCTSTFSKNKESSFILIWDGGMVPHLFYFDFKQKKLSNIGVFFNVIGLLYSYFATHFEPYLVGFTESTSLSVAGKVMAYIALGQTNEDLLNSFQSVYNSFKEKTDLQTVIPKVAFSSTFELSNKFVFVAKAKQLRHKQLSSADIFATLHTFIEHILIAELHNKIGNLGNEYERNLCYVGGTALNIKWNSAIRKSNLFKKIWIPPFPNDSGSSIGAACKGMIQSTGNYHLEWNVYSGPSVIQTHTLHGWQRSAFSLSELAKLIIKTDEPVVFLNGNAEIGPRALGNRSIIAQATSKGMKDLMNKIKERENYRPVAPICIEEYAPGIFTPGTPDPYMLFDHTVKEQWLGKVPAICHLDQSARLQTINRKQNKPVYDLLNEYYKLTGIPLLCNTSANLKGRGFFPDVESVIKWGRVNYIYSEGFLYHRNKLEID